MESKKETIEMSEDWLAYAEPRKRSLFYGRSGINDKMRRRIIEAQGNCCACCGGNLNVAITEGKETIIHHRHLAIEGGTDEAFNLDAVCSPCHKKLHREADERNRVYWAKKLRCGKCQEEIPDIKEYPEICNSCRVGGPKR